MALLTIRNLDDDLKEVLRVRAAKNKRSMEAEARAILKDALKPEGFSVARFRKAIKGLEVDLPIPPRSPARKPPALD
ncbi:MAG: Arc family DNA-binding protein [Archangium sp.]|nr:Arc family DNA-binding protein [Archangium sp.]